MESIIYDKNRYTTGGNSIGRRCCVGVPTGSVWDLEAGRLGSINFVCPDGFLCTDPFGGKLLDLTKSIQGTRSYTF